MSASEKLKAMQPSSWVSSTSAQRSELMAALPQIVAVVSEAERQVRESHEDDVDLELAAALSALEEALGGDVT